MCPGALTCTVGSTPTHVATAAPMALLPRVLGQQQLRTRVVAGEEHHLLLDAFGVAIALEPRLAGVAEVVHGKAGAP